jgi:hypothetical protein
VTKRKDDESYGEREALERMNKALKGAMQKQPETHDEMVRRRQKASKKAKK